MAESQGLVSVIVSVYNIENVLQFCLESLAAQSYRNLEIILIDDGSTDCSGRICDEFVTNDSRSRVIHQENQGVWAVRNRGIDESNGEYVIFPDGDDYFHKDYIRFLFEAINYGGKQFPLAICGFRRTWDYKEDTESDTYPCFEEINQATLLTYATSYPSCASALWGANWNKLYRKSLLPKPFQNEYPRCQDYDSNLRFFFNVERAVLVRKDLYYWLRRSGQLTLSDDYWFLRGESRCRIFYENYRSIPKQLSQFRPNLLTDLYKGMISWKEISRGTSRQQAVSRRIREYERKTLLDLLVCKQAPLHRKLRWILSLHAPSLLGLSGRKVPLEWA